MQAGELVTHLGEHPSLKIGALLETHKHGINDILLESLEAEKTGLELYNRLYELVKDRSVLLEDYARKMIAEEETHLGEVNKMLRKAGRDNAVSGGLTKVKLLPVLERRRQKLAPFSVFLQRLAVAVGGGCCIIALVLFIGVSGYHWLGGLRLG